MDQLFERRAKDMRIGIGQEETELGVKILGIADEAGIAQECRRDVVADENLDQLRELRAKQVGLMPGLVGIPKAAPDSRRPVGAAGRFLLDVRPAGRRRVKLSRLSRPRIPHVAPQPKIASDCGPSLT